jgi:hypothetical protein
LKLERKVKVLDKKYYSLLWVILKFISEDEEIYKNMTLSPLLISNIKEDEYYIKLSFFEWSVYKKFFEIMNKKLWEKLFIDWLPFKFIWFNIPLEWSVFDLDQEILSRENDFNGIKLEFISPTVVKSWWNYKLLPIPELYLYSLIKKFETILWEENFQKYFGFKCSPKVKTLIQDWFMESGYKLETNTIFIKWWYIPAITWYINYTVKKDFQDQIFYILKQKLPIFLYGARWIWLWFWTRLGLWQVIWDIY